MRASGLGVSHAGGVEDASGSMGTVGEGQPQAMVWSKETEGKEMSSRSSRSRGCWEPSSTHPVPVKVTSKSTVAHV